MSDQDNPNNEIPAEQLDEVSGGISAFPDVSISPKKVVSSLPRRMEEEPTGPE